MRHTTAALPHIGALTVWTVAAVAERYDWPPIGVAAWYAAWGGVVVAYA